jgi:hypothetical protein
VIRVVVGLLGLGGGLRGLHGLGATLQEAEKTLVDEPPVAREKWELALWTAWACARRGVPGESSRAVESSE